MLQYITPRVLGWNYILIALCKLSFWAIYTDRNCAVTGNYPDLPYTDTQERISCGGQERHSEHENVNTPGP